MRQEPKIYESTKPKDVAVDTDVVDDGFLDMVSRFFKWIGDNVEFEEYKLDDRHAVSMYDYNYRYEAGQHHIRDDC